jgi:hypothetical protein
MVWTFSYSTDHAQEVVFLNARYLYVILKLPGQVPLHEQANASRRNENTKIVEGKTSGYRHVPWIQQLLQSFSKSFTEPETLHPRAAMPRQKKGSEKRIPLSDQETKNSKGTPERGPF